MPNSDEKDDFDIRDYLTLPTGDSDAHAHPETIKGEFNLDGRDLKGCLLALPAIVHGPDGQEIHLKTHDDYMRWVIGMNIAERRRSFYKTMGEENL
ncbi:hypothetical protein HZA39_04520 [Candidatus Peregrinibacteria bacterium]|nr:hypothetical protein [Candidatus Peregrinibacteria bacterium]